MSLTAQVAGLFYPSEPAILRRMIEGFFKNIKTKIEGSNKIQALIVPHAGYIYSGQTASKAYYQVCNAHYDRVILLGPMHRFYCSSISVYSEGVVSTPLGQVRIDEDFSKRLIGFHHESCFIPEAYWQEHSIEVHIPFLQMALQESWKVVPILVGDVSPEVLDRLAGSIQSLLGNGHSSTLIVASTDFSHFQPAHKAEVLDFKGRDYILDGDSEGLLKANFREETALCGISPVYTLLKLFPGIRPKFLDYSHSGMVSGDQNQVVGYMSFKIEA